RERKCFDQGGMGTHCEPLTAKLLRRKSHCSVLGQRPFVPSLELQSEPDVIHAQVAIYITHKGIRNHFGDLLSHQADVELIAPAVAVSIEAYSVVEAHELDYVPL